MIKFQNKPYLFHIKLTAIWAVSESGLGGLLHAIKLPFSGLFLGSLAVLIITYLAYISQNKFNTILKATLLVVFPCIIRICIPKNLDINNNFWNRIMGVHSGIL